MPALNKLLPDLLQEALSTQRQLRRGPVELTLRHDPDQLRRAASVNPNIAFRAEYVETS